MTKSRETTLIEGALRIYDEMKVNSAPVLIDPKIHELADNYEKLPLTRLHTFWDLKDVIYSIAFGRRNMPHRQFINLYNRSNEEELKRYFKLLNDEEFVKEFRYRFLYEKTFDYYLPIYDLYGLPKNTNLGYSETLDFRDLPATVRSNFLKEWKDEPKLALSYNRKITSTDYIRLKSSSAILHVIVKANAITSANRKATQLAEDSLHIIRFFIERNYQINDYQFVIRDNNETDGMYGFAPLVLESEESILEKSISNPYGNKLLTNIEILSNIFLKYNPNEIEKKIKNALRIFGIQISIEDLQTKYVLLVTCLESLLLSGKDRDYILWRFAEKGAFVLGKNKREVYNCIKDAYRMRSAFVHGNSQENEFLTNKEIIEMNELVHEIVWKLIEFLGQGYTEIQKKEGKKSIDDYIEQIKFDN
jgi:hypothetical protein